MQTNIVFRNFIWKISWWEDGFEIGNSYANSEFSLGAVDNLDFEGVAVGN